MSPDDSTPGERRWQQYLADRARRHRKHRALLLLACYALLYLGSVFLFEPCLGEGITLTALFRLSLVVYFQTRFFQLLYQEFPVD